MKKTLAIATILLGSTIVQGFDFGGILNSALQSTEKSSSSTSKSKSTKSSLSDSTVTSGLKEALSQGVSFAIDELSKDGGYLNNKAVKIPLPENLAKAETLIRKAGGDKYADDLIKSMNKAATKAVPKTAKIFANSVKQMSVDDAQKILTGGDEAATKYFQRTSSKSLQEAIKPIIQETMQENKVASYYTTLNDFYKNNLKSMVDSSNIMSMAKNFGADEYLPSFSDENLDDYVTKKAIDGLFKMIGEKEAQIRKNPVAQTTSLLKQVFGK